MIIAVASGKGGTGKTTISVALAQVASLTFPKVETVYLDCDVEEPNGHLFLNPNFTEEKDVALMVPKVDTEKCNGCKECAKLCKFNAIICIKNKAVTFNDLCHSCGGCSLVCPENAISEVKQKIGLLKIGQVIDNEEAASFKYVQGVLDIGRPVAPPIIDAVREYTLDEGFTIIDSPPGTACPMVASVVNVDFVVLVTEPTPFGLHDLKLAMKTLEKLSLAYGVIINRITNDDNLVSRYCKNNNIEILASIAEERDIAVGSSVGKGLLVSKPSEFEPLKALLMRLASK